MDPKESPEEKSSIQRKLENVNGLVDLRHLTILNILSGDIQSADYTYLRSITGQTSGNLSRHLTRLEETGFIEITEGFVLRRPKIRVSITDEGRNALEEHRRTLERLGEVARGSA